MALDHQDRADLEKTIDQTIGQIPGLVQLSRKEDYIKRMQFKEIDDFVLGFANGMIMGAFVEYFVSRHGRKLDDEEKTEYHEVVYRRNREIKEAIFKCG